jgi:uncharacterized membrane protein YgcG
MNPAASPSPSPSGDDSGADSGRAAVWLLVGLLVLVVLVVVGDRVAGRVMASQIESGLVESGFEEPVEVQLGGFPFLTQLLERRLTRVEVDAPSYLLVPRSEDGQPTAEPIPVTQVHAVLHGAWQRNGDIIARTAEMEGVLAFSEVEQRLGENSNVTLSAAQDGQVRVEAFLEVLGQRLTVAGTADVVAEEGTTIAIYPGRLELPGLSGGDDASDGGSSGSDSSDGGSTDSGSTDSGSSGGGSGSGATPDPDRLALRFPVAGLPQGTRLEAVDVVDDGFRVTLTGTDVVLPQT